MQELTNYNYSDFKLSIRPLNLLLIKMNNNYMPDPPLAGAASLMFQHGEFVNKVNRLYIGHGDI